MKNISRRLGPIVVGGVGGSGTRVVAEILSKWGIYIGSDLNSASDNLLFTLLFKRPKWYSKNVWRREELQKGISLFDKLMCRNGVPSAAELLFLLRAIPPMMFRGHNSTFNTKGIWALKRVKNMLSPISREYNNYLGWGWKEPNTHVYLEHLAAYYKDLRYVHTIRHGLDMAFSKNQQQLINWGECYGIQRPRSESDEPSASLKYWIKANTKVLDVGRQVGAERFLLLNFDQLCLSPEKEIAKLRAFLGVDVEEGAYESALSLPKVPKSMGRRRQHDLTQFDQADLDLVSKFGFSVE
ncbi:sulfotransferase [bacterium]|nr:sulfotransferase [bacterium]